MSDHPDIIWVNKYPNSGMYVHPSKEEAVLRRGEHTNATAAYQRLEDGVDPETHEQVESWSSFFGVTMTGWKPKPQPEPWIPSEGDWFEWRSKSPNGPWSDYVGLCYRSFIHPKNGAVWVEGIHEKYPDNRRYTWSAEFREFRPACPPNPYVPAPKDIFEVDGVRYQRKCPTEDFNIFMAWDFSLADEVRFRTKDIESGDVVCVKVEADG